MSNIVNDLSLERLAEAMAALSFEAARRTRADGEPMTFKHALEAAFTSGFHIALVLQEEGVDLGGVDVNRVPRAAILKVLEAVNEREPRQSPSAN